MIKKSVVLFLLFFHLASPLVLAVELTKKERREVLKLVERQRDFFEAKIANDWEKIYSFLSPRLKSIISLKQFILQPHLPNGVLLPETTRGGAMEELLNKRYVPTHLAYKIINIKLNAGRNFAEVSSEVVQPLPPPMPQVTISSIQEEFWRKVDGVWALEWDIRYLVHLSGAEQRAEARSYIPEFRYSVNLKELAESYLEKVEQFEDESIKHQLIERALVIDPYNAALKIREKKIDDNGLSLKHIDRALLGRRTYTGWYTSYMKTAHWYEVAGDYKAASKSYIGAHGINPGSKEALSGVVSASIKAGDLQKAVKYYVRLLEISSIVKSKAGLPKQFLSLNCKQCKKLKKKTAILLARGLVNAEMYREAYDVYKNIFEQTKQFDKSIEKLKKRKKIKLSQLLEPELLAELPQFTYYEIGALLKEGGVGFFHPADFQKWKVDEGETLIAESSPKLHQVIYENVYLESHIEAESRIVWRKNFSKNAHTEEGYLALFAENDEVNGRFYPDENQNMAGSKKLSGEIGKLKKGTVVVLSRLSTAPRVVYPAFRAELARAGVDVGKLPNLLSAHLIVFHKGKNDSKIWHGKRRIKKIFSGSNMKKFKKSGSASIAVTGKSGRETIKLYLPKEQL